MIMRAAIYARFSSELQDARSIADQVILAEKYAGDRGYRVVRRYEDAAISGASTINRPGLQRLLADARQGEFDVLVTESLDRLSRSQADIASLYEQLTFRGVVIETLSDGRVSEIHIGLKGTMSALFLKDLAQKTRRGQSGRVRAGRIPGGKSYGYDVVRSFDDRGMRTINEQEAGIVRRIFQEYAQGKSPKKIVTDLNHEKVPGPTGNLWGTSALLGSPKRQNGLLNNELYRGTIVYNRQRFLKDPMTGKRVARANPESEWQRRDVPELRIVDEDVWAKVQSLRSSRGGPHLHHRRRPKRMLSGLLRCGCCGGSFIVSGNDYLRCSTRQNSGTCENRRTVRMSEVEERVIAVLRSRLLSPEAVEAAVTAYAEERRRLSADRVRRRSELTRELAQAGRKFKQLLEARLELGSEGGRHLIEEMKEVAREKDRLEAELALAPPPDAVAVHPQLAKRYRDKVSEIHHALKDGSEPALEAIAILRDLVDKIVVSPTPSGEPVELQVVGNLAGFLVQEPSTASVVAGARDMRCSTPVYLIEFA